jgi:hypothetical protein
MKRVGKCFTPAALEFELPASLGSPIRFSNNPALPVV